MRLPSERQGLKRSAVQRDRLQWLYTQRRGLSHNQSAPQQALEGDGWVDERSGREQAILSCLERQVIEPIRRHDLEERPVRFDERVDPGGTAVATGSLLSCI